MDCGGASRSIYQLCRLTTTFPSKVRTGIATEGDVVGFTYGYNASALNVVHAAGFDFRRYKQATVQTATEMLTKVYSKIFKATMELAQPFQLLMLRCLPISGGIFAGRLKPDFPRMTTTAMMTAFAYLSDGEQSQFFNTVTSVELCLFDSTEVQGMFKKIPHEERK